MKGRLHHKGRHHSPSGHHDLHHGGHHKDHALGHTADALKHKSGGKVGGHKAKHHAGGYKRGGRMTPSSPLSGASVKEKEFVGDRIPKEDEGGKGKDSR